MPRLSTAELARRLAAQRQIVAHACGECGASFEAIKRAAFCSVTCKNRAMSRRYRAAHRGAPPSGGA